MKPNKSIDGLVTRDAKKTTSTVPTLKKSVKKPFATTKVAKPKKVESAPDPLLEDSLEINVIEEAIAKADLEKPAQTKKPSVQKSSTNSPTKKVTPKETHEQSIEDFLAPVQAFNFNDEPETTNKPEKQDKTTTNDTSDNNTKKTHAEKKAEKKAEKLKTKEKKKPSKARLIITSILLVIVLLIIGVITWAVIWGNDIIAKITGGQGNVLDLLTFVDDTYEPLKTDSNGRTNILAFGTSGYNMQGDEGDGVHDGAALTDSIMMISLNQDTGDIAMLSLPRDLKASPTCTATGKINEVYWCNNINDDDEAAGATALMTEVGSILGVDFQYYAHLNWGSLIYIVDILGGINITLDEDIFDYGWTDAAYEAGVTYTINGEEALGLARARHGTSGGDFSRGASQQKILIGIKDKVFEKDLSITDLLGLASNLGDNLRTNFNVSELKTLAHLTWEFDFDSMRTISLYPDFMTTGTLDNGISYVFPRAGVGNYGTIQEYVAEQLSNDPRVYEYPTILVLNATDAVGLAGTEKEALIAAGYSNIYTDNAPEAEYETGTTLYVINNKPGTKNMLETYYKQTAKELSDLPAGVSQDYDFVVILNPEPEEEPESTESE